MLLILINCKNDVVLFNFISKYNTLLYIIKVFNWNNEDIEFW